MKKKKTSTGLLLGLTLIGGAIAYALFSNKMSKADAIQLIISYKPTLSYSDLIGMDEGYLISRAEAFKEALPIFKYNGLTYSTSTGYKI